ncbi:hypothetical protein A2U01_0053984, partial [Trifolium medium]|nr:hypothetical protein [Trifolium medium]
FVATGTKFNGDPAHDVVASSVMLDRIKPDGFIWTPYDIDQSIYPENAGCWSAATYLINFEIVEFHQSDRVRLQFGFHGETKDNP